jgi:hypothetical protein
MDPMQLPIYVTVALLAVAMTLMLLLVTKIPAIVTIGAGLLSAAVTVMYGRVDLGYWDPFAPIAFVTITVFAFAVSFVVLWIGRRRKWPLFVRKVGGA